MDNLKCCRCNGKHFDFACMYFALKEKTNTPK